MIDLLLQDIKEGVLMQNRAIKYRIYPSAEQKVLFAKTFWLLQEDLEPDAC